FGWITWREAVLLYKCSTDVRLPIIIAYDDSAGRVINGENWVGKNIRKPQAAERWAQRADHYCLGIRPTDDETVNQDIVAAHDCPAGRKILQSRPHCWKPAVFQVNGSRVVGGVTKHGCVLIPKNLVAFRVQANKYGIAHPRLE